MIAYTQFIAQFIASITGSVEYQIELTTLTTSFIWGGEDIMPSGWVAGITATLPWSFPSHNLGTERIRQSCPISAQVSSINQGQSSVRWIDTDSSAGSTFNIVRRLKPFAKLWMFITGGPQQRILPTEGLTPD